MTKTECVYCAVRTETLNTIQVNRRVREGSIHRTVILPLALYVCETGRLPFTEEHTVSMDILQYAPHH
jgi:hypothetical protein